MKRRATRPAPGGGGADGGVSREVMEGLLTSEALKDTPRMIQIWASSNQVTNIAEVYYTQVKYKKNQSKMYVP